MRLKIRISSDGVAVFILCLLCICLLSPYVARTVGDIPIFVLTLLYLLLERNALLRCGKSERNALLLILLYIIILFVYKGVGLSTASVAYHYNIVKSFIPFICMLPIYQRLTRKQAIVLMVVLVAAVVFTMVHNFTLKSFWKSIFSQKLYKLRGVKGIVTTQYTSAILLFSGIMFCAFLNMKERMIRWLFLAIMILCLIFNTVVTQRGIALFLTILMLPLLLLYNGNRTPKRVIIMLVAILLLFLVILGYRTVLTWLAGLMPSDRLASRINSILKLIDAGGLENAEGGSLAARLRFIGVSIHTFWSSLPRMLFGVGLRTDTNNLVGNHSHFFDEFAKFGVFVGIFSVYNVINMLRQCRKEAGTTKGSGLNSQLSVLFFIYILRAFLGAIFDASIGAVVYFGIPLMFRLIGTEGGIQE